MKLKRNNNWQNENENAKIMKTKTKLKLKNNWQNENEN